MYAGISCGAEIIITPETGYDEVEVLEKLRYLDETKKKNHSIVVISEKITDVELLAQKITDATSFQAVQRCWAIFNVVAHPLLSIVY